MDHNEGILYRMAYGLADQLREAKSHDMQQGRHRTNHAAGTLPEAVLTEVLRQLRVVDPGERELVREAVGDAIEKGRPQWLGFPFWHVVSRQYGQ